MQTPNPLEDKVKQLESELVMVKADSYDKVTRLEKQLEGNGQFIGSIAQGLGVEVNGQAIVDAINELLALKTQHGQQELPVEDAETEVMEEVELPQVDEEVAE